MWNNFYDIKVFSVYMPLLQKHVVHQCYDDEWNCKIHVTHITYFRKVKVYKDFMAGLYFKVS